MYNSSNWYWLVGNKPSVVFASARSAYVALTDADYIAWVEAGNKPTSILCDGELADVLIKAGAPVAMVIAAGATSLGNLSPADCASVSTSTNPVPSEVALWQAKATLQASGLLDKTNAAIAAQNNPVLNSYWAGGVALSRSSPMLATLAQAIGLTDAQIDGLFMQAVTISI